MIPIDDTEAELRRLLERLQFRQAAGPPPGVDPDRRAGRALSLAITRLEECLHWYGEIERRP